MKDFFIDKVLPSIIGFGIGIIIWYEHIRELGHCLYDLTYGEEGFKN